jgi:putative addiction module killer protein
MSSISVLQTDEFRDWLGRLRDRKAIARITSRIRRVELGNPGDFRSLGAGLMEMKIDYGPGYRVYFVHRGLSIVLLLCGGDKHTQRRDIEAARAMAKALPR